MKLEEFTAFMAIVVVVLGVMMGESVKAESDLLPDKLAVTLYKQSNHWSPRKYYNEKDHDFFSVTVNDWQVGRFTNSFYEPTVFIGHEWNKRYFKYIEGYTMLMWVNGYSDARNMLIPVFGARIGPKVGPQAEFEVIPGAFTFGYKFVFSDKD